AFGNRLQGLYDVDSSLYFFQAEDGIRGFHVTGVQTCALPIFLRKLQAVACNVAHAVEDFRRLIVMREDDGAALFLQPVDGVDIVIGRASCRERVWISVVDEAFIRHEQENKATAEDENEIHETE